MFENKCDEAVYIVYDFSTIAILQIFESLINLVTKVGEKFA